MAIPIDSSVMDRVGAADPDRVRAARLADPDVRDRLFALYAFHAELAKVPELVTEPMMGRIRYQWWRDCLGEIYGSGPVRAHEVSTPLAEMVVQTGLSRFYLDRLIDGRERDLDPRPFETMDAATAYADATSGALAAAAATICGGEGGVAAGRAWGLCGLARSYRYYKDGMLKELPFDTILAASEEAYREARTVKPGAALPALAYVSLVPGFLKRMRGQGFDPAGQVPDYAPFLKQVRMLKAVGSGRL
ncbi:squalene/phytoene synthase family protein [uncultured Algimonas sp.]|uniref:squalene/phytoene synthase family protein n=1 Tax=uncultured Algimonas sp. TaxID=1547920 RepID=UPI00261CDBAA|nr:squalene/phytoene synthase family protein [uncultured Algimonas sp.]